MSGSGCMSTFNERKREFKKKDEVYWPYFVRTGRTGRTPRGPLCSQVSCRRGGSRTGSWAGRAELTWRERWSDPQDPWCDPCAGCSWRPCQRGALGRPSEGRWRSRFGADVARHRGSAGPSPDFEKDVQKKRRCDEFWTWFCVFTGMTFIVKIIQLQHRSIPE